MQSGFPSYKAYVLKNRQDLHWFQATDLEAHMWTIETTKNVVVLALRQWNEACQSLANELQEARLVEDVWVSCG